MSTPTGGDDGGQVPHPTTDITTTRSFLHPTDPSTMSAGEAMNYNNIMVIADQNRQTHHMLEALTAQTLKQNRQRSRASSKASETSVDVAEDSENEGLSPKALNEEFGDFLAAQIKSWIDDLAKPVRLTRGRSKNTENDAIEFFGTFLDDAEEKPDNVEKLTSLTTKVKVDLFLIVSKAHAKANPKAKGTKEVSSKLQGSSNIRGRSRGIKAATGTRNATGKAGKAGDEDKDEAEAESEKAASEHGGLGNESDDDVALPPVRDVSRRNSAVTIATTSGARHPDSSFSAREDDQPETGRPSKRLREE